MRVLTSTFQKKYPKLWRISKTVIVIAIVVLGGWLAFRFLFWPEITVALFNYQDKGVTLHKVTVDGRVVYEGTGLFHAPREPAFKHRHFITFSAPPRKVNISFLLSNDRSVMTTTSCQIEARDGPCLLNVGYRGGQDVTCACDFYTRDFK